MQKTTTLLLLALVTACMVAFAEASTDAEIIEEIVQFHRPRGGDEPGRGGRRPELIEVLEIGGDTNRLARLLAGLAMTNDSWNANMAIRELGKYGTPEQLPFLYSCATNPAVGDRAVRSVLHIEGVTSNSLSVAQIYVSLTNGFPLMNSDDRSDLCRDIVKTVFADNTLSIYRPFVFDIACGFARDVNVMPKGLDKTLVGVEPDFRFTKRRLAILRSAQTRLNERFRVMDPCSVHFESESHIYDVQTNFLTFAINELVAYPESDLPD